MTTKSTNTTLSGQRALDLFSQGRDAWNEYMAKYPNTEVDFKGADFTNYRIDGVLSFSGFQFPATVSFAKATFGYGKVDFSATNFGNGNVKFSLANFGDGDVDFSEASFGDGDVDYIGANFGDGQVSFSKSNFGDGNVYFSGVTFSDKGVYFTKTKFGNGNVYFSGVTFGNGDVYFYGTNFGNGNVNFYRAIFGEKGANFSKSIFGAGSLNFADITVKGNLLFRDAQTEAGNIDFSGINVGKLDFSFARLGGVWCHIEEDDSDTPFLNESANYHFNMTNAQIGGIFIMPNRDLRAFSEVSFRGAKFDRLIDISFCRFRSIPDFTATSISHHIAIDQLHIDIPKKGSSYQAEDSAKARRLKELAKKAEDRQTELNMLAIELNAMSALKEVGLLARWLNALYRLISNYGRSILQPSMLLLGTILLSFLFYWGQASYDTTPQISAWSSALEAIELSISQSLPFLSWSRPVRDSSIHLLFNDDINSIPGLETIGLLQSFLSYLALFFIGLGIRNRFKL